MNAEQPVLRPGTHLLVVAPHPDDETLALGGTLHDHLRQGGSAEVIAVTDGEAADDESGLGAQRALRLRRSAERARAFRCLGIEHVPVACLGVPDRHVDAAEERLTRELERRFTEARVSRPECLAVVPWQFDRHPDHEATWAAAAGAASSAGIALAEVPIWGWYAEASREELPAARLRAWAISPEARRAKRAALRCFASQLEPLPGRRGPVLPADFLAAFDRSFEPVLL